MIVQQLVENAIKHGIVIASNGGHVSLSIHRTGREVQIKVENTGKLSPTSNAGLGLANARERLRLLCGPDSALSLRDTEDGRVVATVQITES